MDIERLLKRPAAEHAEQPQQQDDQEDRTDRNAVRTVCRPVHPAAVAQENQDDKDDQEDCHTASVASRGHLRNGESGLTRRFRSPQRGASVPLQPFRSGSASSNPRAHAFAAAWCAGVASQRVRNTRAYRVVHVSQRQLVGLGKKIPGR